MWWWTKVGLVLVGPVIQRMSSTASPFEALVDMTSTGPNRANCRYEHEVIDIVLVLISLSA